MREVKLGGLVYKEEIISLPDEFDAIYDRLMELDEKDFSELTPEEEDEPNDLAQKMWDEVNNSYYSSDFSELLILETADGENIIWEE